MKRSSAASSNASDEMNKYNGNQQPPLHHYGGQQYPGQEESNGNKHLRVPQGHGGHSMGNGGGGPYHQNNSDQNQDLGHVSAKHEV